MPGSSAHGLTAAAAVPADSVLLDLEGTVADVEKELARDRVCKAVADNRDRAVFGEREVAVRINGRSTSWFGDDLRAVCAARPDSIILPKVRSAADIVALDHAMEGLGAHQHIAIWSMLETPSGVVNAHEIAAATPRLTAVLLGTNDLTAELDTEHEDDRGPLLYALSRCVVAARAAGILVIDGVHNADDDRFEAEARQGRRLGFDGKLLAHASQVAVTNEIFGRGRERVPT